jgi:hypothetical protein
MGIEYARQNQLRKFVQNLPFYRFGAYFKRRSTVKKVANRALNLTEFTVSKLDCETALDLLAICYKT